MEKWSWKSLLFIKISVMRFFKNNLKYLRIKNIENKTNIFPKFTNLRMSIFNITYFIFVLTILSKASLGHSNCTANWCHSCIHSLPDTLEHVEHLWRNSVVAVLELRPISLKERLWRALLLQHGLGRVLLESQDLREPGVYTHLRYRDVYKCYTFMVKKSLIRTWFWISFACKYIHCYLHINHDDQIFLLVWSFMQQWEKIWDQTYNKTYESAF